MTVAELLERMSSREFSEWMIYYEIEPFGEERADWRQAMTTSAVHNNFQAKAKTPKWTKPEDFMPFKHDQEPPEEKDESVDAAELHEKFDALAGDWMAPDD